jgi:hypothetical protein
MGLQESMMRWWLRRYCPEESASMAPRMMGEMFRTMDPEEMRSMMEVTMPFMMDQCLSKMK